MTSNSTVFYAQGVVIRTAQTHCRVCTPGRYSPATGKIAAVPGGEMLRAVIVRIEVHMVVALEHLAWSVVSPWRAPSPCAAPRHRGSCSPGSCRVKLFSSSSLAVPGRRRRTAVGRPGFRYARWARSCSRNPASVWSSAPSTGTSTAGAIAPPRYTGRLLHAADEIRLVAVLSQ